MNIKELTYYGEYIRQYPCRYVYLTLDYISLSHS